MSLARTSLSEMSLARTSLSEILHSSVNSSQRSRRLFPKDMDPAMLAMWPFPTKQAQILCKLQATYRTYAPTRI